ncbi:MAG: PEGA domain-containing protein [Candidatus Delongbacteria bacterium]|nr:PEGA domain-containing protein [Candidatus Delongbacteria bacterium]
MKKLILLILIAIGLAYCADFKLVSYKADSSDLDARQSNVMDDNGNKTGLLKIHSDQSGFLVISNLGVVETDKSHPGEFWAYLSRGEKFIKVSKEGFAPFEFVMEPSIESDMVYVLKLATVGSGNVMDDGLFRLTFNINVEGVHIGKDKGAPVQVSGKSAEFRLAKGDYVFTFIKDGFLDKKENISLNSDREVNIELTPGSNRANLKMPGIVSISSDPSGAEIFLNGQKFGITPMQESLIAGEYTISVRSNFYYTHEGTFTVNEGQMLDLPEIKLKPRFGYYSLKADQVDAKLYLDGVYLGDKAVPKTRIESGKHIFKAEKDLYYSDTKEVEFKDGDEIDVDLALKPNFGKLIIKSEPSEAVLWLNGRNVGKTPYIVEKAKSGRYTVKITRELWSDYEDIIEVSDSQTAERTFVMNKNFGTLKINADKSEIFINGKKEGNGAYQGNLSPGRYDIVAKRDRHKDATREVFINIGREQEVSLEPEPIMGSVNIFSEPAETKGAKIFLNGEDKGKTPAVVPLLIGDYKLRLTYDGYLDKSEDFSLSEGENKTLRLTMQTYEGSQKEKRDFWKKQKWYALGAFAVWAGAGGYFYWAGNDYYDQYESAPLTSTSAEVQGLREDAISSDKYRDISFSVSLAPLGYFFYSWYKESSYK